MWMLFVGITVFFFLNWDFNSVHALNKFGQDHHEAGNQRWNLYKTKERESATRKRSKNN